MKQPWDKEIQICANKVPGVINGPTLRKGSKRPNAKFGMDHPNGM